MTVIMTDNSDCVGIFSSCRNHEKGKEKIQYQSSLISHVT